MNKQKNLKLRRKHPSTSTEVLEDGAAFQGFEQTLASITMLVGEAPKNKEEIVPAKADKIVSKTSKDKIQIKLKQ